MLLFFLFILSNGLISYGIGLCDLNHWEGNLTCVVNEDDTYNITFDCNLNVKKSAELMLWSDLSPMSTKALTIKNCENITLDVTKSSSNSSNHQFLHLHVVNISELIITQNPRITKRGIIVTPKPRNPTDRIYMDAYEPKDEDSRPRIRTTFFPPIIREKKDPEGRLPPEVILENIGMLKIEDPLEQHNYLDDTLISLKLINVTIEDLPSNFLKDRKVLKELIMDKITVTQMSYWNTISLQNREATVKITDSILNSTLSGFLVCRVSKLIITGNILKELNRDAFKCVTDEFILSDNEIEKLNSPLGSTYSSEPCPCALNIKSPFVNIHGNIFHYVQSNGFLGIKPPTVELGIGKNHSDRIYNFTNNQIYIAGNGAFSLSDFTVEKSFNKLNFFNNSINCTCQNVPFFEHLFERTRFAAQRQIMYFQWVKKNNQNKCLNIPTCGLLQVAHNFYDLCDDTYHCPSNVSTELMVNHETNLLYLTDGILNMQGKIAESNQEILKVALDEKEETRYYWGNLSKILTDKFLIGNENVAEEQTIIVWLMMTIAIGFALHLIFKCLGIEIFKLVRSIDCTCPKLKCRKRKVLDTEMNSHISPEPLIDV